jgi:ADP-L-glycero-D-manno-heptose 6-epimerase
MSDEKWRNLVALKYIDYLESDHLLEALPDLGEVKTVFHLGACSATTERDCRYLVNNNYEYTKTLAKWSLKNKAKFVYASSAATYGDGVKGMDDKEPNLHGLRPLNMYGYSKQMFDLYAQRQGWLSRIVGLKYFNVFGPNEDHKGDMRSVVNKAYQQIRDTGKAKLFKSYHPDYQDGEQMRDFLYVKDAVDMTIHLASSKSAAGIYNVGSSKANTWISLVTPIFKALDLPVDIDMIEMPEHLRGKYQYFTQANVEKIQSTGYGGNVFSLAEAVTDYVKNYLVSDKRLGDE